MLEGARKDLSTVAADGLPHRRLPDGVVLRDVRNVVTRNGIATEVYRSDWDAGTSPVAQALYVSLRGGAISAWHCHHRQLDRIFVVLGTIKLVLYDDREASPTRGMVSELHLDRAAPCLVTIPPRVWHGIQNLRHDDCGFLNCFDRLYDHADPDEWRLPVVNDAIPYRF